MLTFMHFIVSCKNWVPICHFYCLVHRFYHFIISYFNFTFRYQQDIANVFNKYFSSVNNSESNSDNLENMEYKTSLHTVISIKVRELLFLPWYLNPFPQKR
jgi:hypothetical protein